MARAGLGDPTVGGRFGAQPPLDLLHAALGMKIFGASELGARLFGALFAVLAILAVYWGGVGCSASGPACSARWPWEHAALLVAGAAAHRRHRPRGRAGPGHGGLGRYLGRPAGAARSSICWWARWAWRWGCSRAGRCSGWRCPAWRWRDHRAGWGLRAHAAESEAASVLTARHRPRRARRPELRGRLLRRAAGRWWALALVALAGLVG
jgi:hypothetical protein